MAQELEMSVSGFSRLERNEVNISLKRLSRIAEILKIQVSDLLSDGPVLLPAKLTESAPLNPGVLTHLSNGVEVVYQKQIEHMAEEIRYLRNLLHELCGKIPDQQI